VLYVGIEGGGVYRSLDAGANWSGVSDGLVDRNVFGLAIDPHSPDRLYAATAASVFATGRTGTATHDDDDRDDDGRDARPEHDLDGRGGR
jgi:hypothetical protein